MKDLFASTIIAFLALGQLALPARRGWASHRRFDHVKENFTTG
jgi:hypothetical protein